MVRSEDDEEELAERDRMARLPDEIPFEEHMENLEAVQREVGVYISENTVAVAVVLLDKLSNELQRTLIPAKAGDMLEIRVPTLKDFINAGKEESET
jgi:hypothetical protein